MKSLALRYGCAAAGAAALVLGLVSSAQATDPVAKWCTGVKIAAFPGGPQGGVFANNVYNGFRQAELDLGPTVTYYFSNWDPNKMLTQIQQAIATKVDGIATMGFPATPRPIRWSTRPLRRARSSPRRTRRCRTPGEIWAAGLRLCRRAQLRGRLRAWRRSRQARRLESRRQAFVWGLKAPGRRPRPAHRRRDRRASTRPAPR